MDCKVHYVGTKYFRIIEFTLHLEQRIGKSDQNMYTMGKLKETQ